MELTWDCWLAIPKSAWRVFVGVPEADVFACVVVAPARFIVPASSARLVAVLPVEEPLIALPDWVRLPFESVIGLLVEAPDATDAVMLFPVTELVVAPVGAVVWVLLCRLLTSALPSRLGAEPEATESVLVAVLPV